jgi:hypothetical protein
MFYAFSGIGRLLAKILVIVMKIFGITLGLTILGYCLGILFEMNNSFAISLNNGFYFLGIDIQYNFAEVFATIGLLVGFIGSGILTIFNLILTSRVAPVAAQASVAAVNESSKKEFDQSELAMLVPMVNHSLETKLYKIGVNTVAQLANAKPEALADIVGSPEMAKVLIDDAQKTLDKIFRE